MEHGKYAKKMVNVSVFIKFRRYNITKLRYDYFYRGDPFFTFMNTVDSKVDTNKLHVR